MDSTKSPHDATSLQELCILLNNCVRAGSDYRELGVDLTSLPTWGKNPLRCTHGVYSWDAEADDVLLTCGSAWFIGPAADYR